MRFGTWHRLLGTDYCSKYRLSANRNMLVRISMIRTIGLYVSMNALLAMHCEKISNVHPSKVTFAAAGVLCSMTVWQMWFDCWCHHEKQNTKSLFLNFSNCSIIRAFLLTPLELVYHWARLLWVMNIRDKFAEKLAQRRAARPPAAPVSLPASSAAEHERRYD